MPEIKTSKDLEQAAEEALAAVERVENKTKATAQPDELEFEVASEEQTVEEVEQSTEEVHEELAAVKDQLLRMAADFDNYRKRMAREREEMRRFAVEQLVRDLLPVLDNFDRALAHSQEGVDDDPLVQGIRMVAKQLVDTLGNHGVQGFSAIGEVFDPELHEAMGQLPSAEAAPGSVVQELEKGYKLNGRLLRPAKTIVAIAMPAEEPDTGEPGGDQTDSEEG